MSDFQSSSAASEMIGEEDQPPEKMDENSTVLLRDEVMNNDYLAHHVLSFLHNPIDKVHAERVNKKWNFLVNDYNDRSTTLYIIRVNLHYHSLVQCFYGNSTWILKLYHNYLLKPQFDQIMSRLSEDTVQNKIHRIVIRGFRDNMVRATCLFTDEDLADFLDNFKTLKYLELELVFCESPFFENLENHTFQNKLKSLFLPYTSNYFDMLNLIGGNVEVLHMFEDSFFYLTYHGFQESFYHIPMRFVLYKETGREPDIYDEEMDYHSNMGAHDTHIWNFEKEGRYFEILHTNHFIRELHLHQPIVPSIKYCLDLTTLKLFRLKECGDDDVIMKRITEIRFFPKLGILRIDGFFDRRHFRKVLGILKQCRMLTHVALRRRNATETDWICLIERLPKNLLCVKLDGLTSNEAITALKVRLSKSLRNLEIVVRDKDISLESFKKLIYGFKKLRFLKFIGFDPRGPEYSECLESSPISRIEFFLRAASPGCFPRITRLKYTYTSENGKFLNVYGAYSPLEFDDTD